MSKSSAIPYQLRPNKAADRELFLSFLSWLNPLLELNNYRYIGLGGPFLEDFKLIYSSLGIENLYCIEAEKNTHQRQNFNKPVNSIKCIHSTLEDYLDETEIEDPIIIWFDYTDPSAIYDQIKFFSEQVSILPLNSILRITINANPSSLDNQKDKLAGDELLKRRLTIFKDKTSEFFPIGIKFNDMVTKKFGFSILKSLKIAVDKSTQNLLECYVHWAFSTYYSDGQPMITATLVITSNENLELNTQIKKWEYYSDILNPHILDLPPLSTLERITLESKSNPQEVLNYELPVARLGENPFSTFEKYRRIYPHFARVEI